MVAVHKNRLAGTLARQKISPQFLFVMRARSSTNPHAINSPHNTLQAESVLTRLKAELHRE
jgi:hypothetical protein